MPGGLRERRRVTGAARALAVLVAAALLWVAGPHVVLRIVESQAFATPPAGTLLPDALGAPSRQLSFASGDRRLRASWVPTEGLAAPALAIFHGDEEELSRWAGVQAHLHAAGIASFVFDYSGYGASSGTPSVARLQEDARAAWQQFVALTPHAHRRVALGFSLGSAVLADALGDLQPPPHAVVIGAGFASAREMAVSTGLVPGWAAWVLPDVWNTERALAGIGPPLLIVHSRNDELIPAEQASRLCRAARGPRRMVLLDGMLHDDPLEPARSQAFWGVVIDAMRSGDFGAAGDARRACGTP